MEVDLYRKVMDEIATYSEPVRSREIELFHFGESLLHPLIDEMVGYASALGLNVSLSVNAPYLTPPLAERLLRGRPARLIISLDGNDQESYQRIRGAAADYQKARTNLEQLLPVIQDARVDTDICIRIIRLHDNEAFIDTLRQEWESKGIPVEIRPFFPWTEKEMVALGHVEKYPPGMPCPFPWQYLVVQWDGTVVPCCRDYNAVNALGNVKHNTLREIWEREASRTIREQHRTGRYGSNNFCKKCMDIFFTEPATPDTRASITTCSHCQSLGLQEQMSMQKGWRADLHQGLLFQEWAEAKGKEVPALTLNRQQCAALFLSETLCCTQAIADQMGINSGQLEALLLPILNAGAITTRAAARPDVRLEARSAQTIRQLWEQAVDKFADRPLLVSDEDGSTFRYRDAERAVDLTAARLVAAGVGHGDRVCTFASQNSEALFAFWASLRLGAVFVPFDFRLPSRSLKTLLDQVAPRIVFCDTAGYKKLRETAPGVPCIVFDDAEDLPLRETERFSDWLDASEGAAVPNREIGPEDPAVILFTSGTSGRQKGVELSHGSLYRSGTLMARTYGWQPGDVLLNLGDFHTMSGLRNPAVASLHAGCCIVLTPPAARANALVVADCFHRNGVTLLGTVPALLRQFCRFADRLEGSDLASLRQVVCTGSVLTPDVRNSFSSRFSVPVYDYYGLTETGGICAGMGPHTSVSNPASIGRPLESLFRVESRKGEALGPGQVGAVLIYTPNLMEGYYQDRELTRLMIQDGWYRTGDLAYRDLDGGLVLVGREGDAVKDVRGELIPPDEFEACLEQLPLIEEAGLCGYVDSDGGESLAAFVIPSCDVHDKDAFIRTLCSYVHQELGAHKVPSRIELVHDLPRGTNGKLLRRKLHVRSHQNG